MFNVLFYSMNTKARQIYKKKAKHRTRIQLFIIYLQKIGNMPNDYFRFKQFSIHHDRCAMKVGTDGVLLGAWGCVEGRRILDIGTGTGLIALMSAQRNPVAQVLGIDIDEQAISQARENIARSPFSNRVNCIGQDILTYQPETSFDAILCNPPFFTEDTLPDDTGRALARNSKSLPFSDLIRKASCLLADDGMFSVIIPYHSMTEFIVCCLSERLHLCRRCIVRTTARKPPRRVLLSFAKRFAITDATCKEEVLCLTTCQEEAMCLTSDDGSRSNDYKELTKDFYL